MPITSPPTRDTDPAPAIAPGEGERRALRGYVSQYSSSAAAIYAALERGELEWVGLADRTAGIADDVVLGLPGRVVGHQFKTSRFPDRFRLRTLLTGADGLLQPLATAWKALKCSNPGRAVEIRLVTNDYPSNNDNLIDENGSQSAVFLTEFEAHPERTLAEWRASRWKPLINDLCVASGLCNQDFDQFLQSLRILHGRAADFVQVHRLTLEGARLASEIAAVLPRLVADARDKDRWTRAELLHELGWRNSTVAHHIHQFPVGAYVQRNAPTEIALREAIHGHTSGYVSLVGPPGAGKSTLLQASLESEQDLFLVRYLAFVPGVGQGVGRGEADDFFDDLSTQLKRTGLRGLRFRDESLHERREQFTSLLREASERFARDGIRTLIVIDGLDHVPREERPQRSFLTELPLPGSVPDGVLFVLGTQRVNLDDIKPAVQDQADSPDRCIVVAPLVREAVHRMADLLGLDAGIDRDIVFGLSRGHPLVTRYLIEALREADVATREALLAGAMTFDGDIEAVYESAWRGIRDDEQARTVLDYLARAEGPMPLELLTQSIPEQAIERALYATRHLLAEGQHGWSVFHNSFRLFILDKPRLRLGKPDPAYGKRVYQELAALARAAPNDSPQRWLELRYMARAEEHASVLTLATPTRFRQQLAERRSFAELTADLRLAFASARYAYDPLKVFQLLLIQDEIGRRWSACEEASDIVGALLYIGDLDGAVAFVEQVPAQGYEVVDALLDAGEVARARALFDQLEPLQQLLSGTSFGNPLGVSELQDWARRVIHFRDVDQILLAIQRLSKAARLPGFETSQEAIDEVASYLRREAALAIATAQDSVDILELGQRFSLDAAALVGHRVEAGIAAAERGAIDSALTNFREALSQAFFSQVSNASRRKASLIAARSGGAELAGSIFDGLQTPTLADLDDLADQGAPEHMARAVLEHAELAALLGRQTAAAPASDRQTLRPLQFHAEAIGRVLGRARLEPLLVHSGEIARIAQAALIYLDRVQPSGGEFYALHQVASATPVLGKSLIRAAALCGEQEFASTVAEFDRAFAAPDGTNGARTNLRREVAVEIYRCTGDTDEASRRLEPMVAGLMENTPAQQIDGLANLAIAFAQVGNLVRAKALLARLPEESLGYALPPKKDSQYATWRELLERANQADPAGRPGRVAILLRQVTGMMKTEGCSAAYRIAGALLKEAATCDAQTGWAAGRLLVEQGAIGWARLVDALLFGLVKRRPELVPVATVIWCELALPYYMEPYFNEPELGTFIEAAIGAASPGDAKAVSDHFLAAIETESRAHERAALLDRLCRVARTRGAWGQAMEAARVRWKAESPPPRHSYTPTRYDDVSSLPELKTQLEQDVASGEPGYEAAHAFNRLAPEAGLALAKEIFDRWGTIQRDSRARFVVINLAINSGQTDVARELMQGYESKSDDRATWTEWTGGSSLRYFKAKRRLEGAQVHEEAYDDFVGSLAAGRESIMSVLLEQDAIFPTLTETPDWAGMWDSMAEQLVTTRENAMGSAFDAGDSTGLSDDDLIASLFTWALSLPLDELRRHALTGALLLQATKGGRPVFVQLVRRLLAGADDEPGDGIQLLLLETSNTAAREFDREVLQLTEHADYAVAESAFVLARRWGLSPLRKTGAMPSFYSLILEDEDSFERPRIVDAASGAMLVEDPLGWTHAFGDQIELLTGSGVSAAHIRHRCRMFIEQWGGLGKFGKVATEQLESDLRRLDMKLTYARPHIVVASRALRYVAGELRRGGAIPDTMTLELLYMMGYPAPRPPLILPVSRPTFIRRPVLDDTNWRTPEEDWLNGAAEDTHSLDTGNNTIAVEVCEFHIRNSRRTFHMRRVRAPGLDLDNDDRDFDGFDLLPRAIWLGQVRAMSRAPASTIARGLVVSWTPEVPRFRLAICPHWLQKLGWHTHASNELVFLDNDDILVARIVWWRDGGPVDLEDDAIWGQGFYLNLTPVGRQQIEALTGSLDVRVLARRSYKPDTRDKAEESRLADSRD